MTTAALRGALLGLAVAVLARWWMRLVAHDPEFTWGGTIAILVVFTIFGSCTGLVGAALDRGRSPWWRVAAVPGLAAFLAQGIVVLPLALLSASLFARRGPLWSRWALAGAGIVGTVAIADDQGTTDLPLTIAGMLALGLAGGVGWGRVLRRRRPAPSTTA
jgi:hypothetical protein